MCRIQEWYLTHTDTLTSLITFVLIAGTSVCNGDSGGGMYFTKNDDADVWQIRGLVSIGVALQGKTCNPSHYVIFTDLAKHLDWIKETMQ